MDTLFPIERKFPAGFVYVPGFLTEAEEQLLCSQIATLELKTFIFKGFEAKRKVASFGFDYSFEGRSISKGQPIPDFFEPLVSKVANHLFISKNDFAELLVSQYSEGSVINWHRDAFPFELIAGISLNFDCIFRLRPHDKALQGRGSIISFPVERRSLYVMQGDARMNWQHSIAPVNKTRYSITLRTLREAAKLKSTIAP